MKLRKLRMQQCKISVLITFYNQEKYVDECLKSVFMQKTSFPFKVIVGDDGSTDKTLEKLQEWKTKYPEQLTILQMPRDPKVKYIAGSRASKNRLALLEQVDTKYFHYLDGDDYWTDENKLQIGYDILEKEENSDCIGCAHSICVFHEKDIAKTVQCLGQVVEEGKYSLERYWRDMYFHTDTILFRSENIPNLPYHLLEDNFNDSMITFCLLQFGSIYFVNREMAAYRQNDKGIWVGERKIVGVIRELMMYELEMKMNSKIKLISTKRHWGNLMYIHKNRDKLVDLEPYYEIAEKYNLPLTRNVIKTKCVFTGHYITDKLFILGIKIRFFLDRIKGKR